MVYNEIIDQLVIEINYLNRIFSQNQNDFFIELDSLKVLQNNIKILSINLKNSNFIQNEINKLHDLVFSPRIVILGNNPLTIEVYTDLATIELGAIGYDYNNNIIDVSSISNIDNTITGTYYVNYYAIDSCGNDISASRTVYVVDTTPPELSLIGENPLIWNINVPYVDPGINIVDNYDTSFNTIITNLVNIYQTGIYSYKYTVIDKSDNRSELIRVVYVLDYTILDNIPIINISENSSQNIVNILKFTENTNFFPNNELSMTDDFTLYFENKNINYKIPLELLKNSFTNYYKMNNMIIFVYGFTNEKIHIIESNDNVNSEYPYISERLDIKNLVNLFINNNERYKMLILNGKESNLLEHRKPNLTLLGNNPFDLSLNNTFIDPGYNAQDYNGNDISVNTYDNINNNLIGNYNILYVATDNSGNQNIQNRKVNVVNTIEIN